MARYQIDEIRYGCAISPRIPCLSGVFYRSHEGPRANEGGGWRRILQKTPPTDFFD